MAELMFGRGKKPLTEDEASTRLVVARLETIADRYEAVYDQIARALKPISPIDDGESRKDPQ